MSRHAALLLLAGAEPTDDLRDRARVVAELIRDAAATETLALGAANAMAAHFRANSNLEGDAVVTIGGHRGSGKTTLLMTACLSIAGDGDTAVLPIIRPDDIRASISLTSIFVSSLTEMVDTLGASDPSFARAAQSAQKAAALAAPDASSMLTRGTESLAQYAMDTAGLVRYQDQLRPALEQLTVAARGVLSLQPAAPIVVPFDDADLVPGRTLELLQEIRLLARLPGVVPLICASLPDLRRHLEADLTRLFEQGSTRSPVSRDLARLQIEKTIRTARTVEPAYLTFERRFAFAPLGQSVTLLDLLEKVIRALDAGGEVSETLVDWFKKDVPTADSRVTGMAWLPDTPRELEDFYLVARDLLTALQSGEVHRIGPWLSKLVALIGAGSPFSFSLDVQSVKVVDRSFRIDAISRWSDGLNFAPVGIGPWSTVTNDSVSRVRLRQFAGPVGIVEAGGGNEEQKSLEVSPRYVSAYLAIADIFRLNAFDQPGPNVPMYVGDRDYSRLQSVRLLDEETDDHFFEMPRSFGGVHVDRARRCWNQLWNFDVSRERGRQTPPDLVGRYVRLVTRCWLDGEAVEVVDAEHLPSVVELVAAAVARVRNIRARVGDDYQYKSAQDSDFIRWFEVTLPQVFHEELLGASVVDDSVALWLNVLTVDGVSPDIVATIFRERMRSVVTPEQKVLQEGVWFYGYRSLLEALGHEFVEEIAHQASLYLRARSRAQIGRIVAEHAATVSETGTEKFAEISSREGDAEYELISAVLSQLRS